MSNERRNRIKLAVAAYAYEVLDDPVMTDEQFDRLSRQINPTVVTGNLTLDVFFQTIWTPHSGQWVRQHPDLPAVAHICTTIGPLIRAYNLEGERYERS